jgi:type II secretory pathway component PulK
MRTSWNRGVVLEVVLLTAMIVFVLAACMIEIGAARFRAASTRYRQTQAFYYAEAGIARVMAGLARESELEWTGQDQPLGDGVYRVTIGREDDETVIVNSTGEFRRPNGERITENLRVVLRPSTGRDGYDLISWQQLNP